MLFRSTSELIKKMRGYCEFEPEKPRAPKASYSFELFRLAQNLSHLRIVVDQETRQLSEDEIAKIIEKAKNVKVLKYEHIRDILGYKGDQSFSFAHQWRFLETVGIIMRKKSLKIGRIL